MPIFSDPHHPDCSIRCEGTGGASFIPPFRCVTWCGDATAIIRAYDETIAQEGWGFVSSLRADWSGWQAMEIAERLRGHDRPPPDAVVDALKQISQIGSDWRDRTFSLAWPVLPFPWALRVALVSMRGSLELPPG
jgi:hypothetical protein